MRVVHSLLSFRPEVLERKWLKTRICPRSTSNAGSSSLQTSFIVAHRHSKKLGMRNMLRSALTLNSPAASNASSISSVSSRKTLTEALNAFKTLANQTSWQRPQRSKPTHPSAESLRSATPSGRDVVGVLQTLGGRDRHHAQKWCQDIFVVWDLPLRSEI